MVDVYTEITVTIRLNFGNSNKRQRKALSLKIVTVVKAVEMLGTDHGFFLSNYSQPHHTIDEEDSPPTCLHNARTVHAL